MRLRLIASFILIVIVTIGVVVVVSAKQTAQEVRNFMFRGGMTGSNEIVTALEEYYAAYQTWEGADAILKSAGMMRHGMGEAQGGGMQGQIPSSSRLLHLVDHDGTIVAANPGSDLSGTLTQAELRSAILLEVDGETVGYLYLEGGQAFTQANESFLLSRLNRTAGIAAGIAGGIAVLLGLFLAYSLLRPVRDLTQAASRLGAGDLSQRVPVKGRDELAKLGITFNQMAESLQQAESSRRALTADIAHELRTPLAVQRAHLEALEDGIYELTPENLATIEEQNHLLTRLVDDLRTLALADAGQLALETVPTDFSALIERVANRFKPQAEERSIEIQLNLNDSVPLLSIDPQRIEQILHNLLSNAFRYTPEGGCISMQLNRDPDKIVLNVLDNGPGIPESAILRIFDRFYRADKSRSREEGGTGLGLSIARKIAQAHGGDLTARNHPEGGAVFTLSLPVESDD